MTDKLTLAPDRDPWARQPGENARWYDRFDRFYRPAGAERSLYRAYTEHLKEKSGRTGAQYSAAAGVSAGWRRAYSRDRWAERAAAWDDAVRADRYAAERDAVAAMQRRHLRLATGMQRAGGLKLAVLAKDEAGAGGLNPTEARQYITAGVTLERSARGLPTHLIAVAELDDDALAARYRELLAAMGAGQSAEADGDGA